jgi:hypothetical protein
MPKTPILPNGCYKLPSVYFIVLLIPVRLNTPMLYQNFFIRSDTLIVFEPLELIILNLLGRRVSTKLNAIL